MTEMVYGAVPVQAGEPVVPKWWRTVDKLTLSCVLVLFAIGLLLVMASSQPLADKHDLPYYHYVQRQAIFGSLALILMVITSMLSPVFVRRLSVIGCFIALIALALLPFYGTDFGKGAVRWYSLGFAALQPSEFLKPLFLVTSAWMISANFELNGPPGRMYSFCLCIVIVLLLAFEPDFGQASLVLFGWGVMYFVSGAPMLVLIAMLGLILLGALIAYASYDHFANRIDDFLNPELDPTSQLGYAANAIREGGLFGVGVGGGEVKWILPDGHTDFIIAVAAEEYGLFFVLFVILIYTVIVLRALLRLMRERDMFIRLAGAGLISMYGVQAMINLGVAVRLLPAKGMTLPFISYGGSSLIASGLALGMLLAFTRSRPQGELSELLNRGRAG